MESLRGRPGDLRAVRRVVDPKLFQVTALLEALESAGAYPAVHFEKPTAATGDASQFTLLTNLFASRERCAEMLGFDREATGAELGIRFSERVKSRTASCLVDATEAPVHANVLTGQDATLNILPLVRHFEMDLGSVLTMANVMRPPDGDFYNITFAKWFPDEAGRRAGITIHTPDMSRMLGEWSRRGERVPIVNVLGHDPAFSLGSLALTPYGTNEYESIGACMGRPVRLTPSVTWGSAFLVPADAEIVVEAEVVPGESAVVNPFGEISRQYQAQELAPVTEVRAITFRDSAIMQDVFSAHREHFLLGLIPREGSIYNALKRDLGNVVAVNLPFSGCGRFSCYISIDNPREGQAKLAAVKVLGIAPALQAIVVVDGDIDVYREEDVLWALNMYVDPWRDVDVLKNMREPVGFHAMRGNRVLIDATKPRDTVFPSRPRVPEDALKGLRLEDWLVPEEAGA